VSLNRVNTTHCFLDCEVEDERNSRCQEMRDGLSRCFARSSMVVIEMAKHKCVVWITGEETKDKDLKNQENQDSESQSRNDVCTSEYSVVVVVHLSECKSMS
jgi:hypothetical protein